MTAHSLKKLRVPSCRFGYISYDYLLLSRITFVFVYSLSGDSGQAVRAMETSIQQKKKTIWNPSLLVLSSYRIGSKRVPPGGGEFSFSKDQKCMAIERASCDILTLPGETEAD